MSQEVFAPLEEAVESATLTLERLRARLADLRQEKAELAAEVERLRGRASEGVAEGDPDDERVAALIEERQVVRRRLRALLEKISEVDLGD